MTRFTQRVRCVVTVAVEVEETLLPDGRILLRSTKLPWLMAEGRRPKIVTRRFDQVVAAWIRQTASRLCAGPAPLA